MAAKTLMNVHEALEYLENLDVFSMRIQEMKMSFSQLIQTGVNF